MTPAERTQARTCDCTMAQLKQQVESNPKPLRFLPWTPRTGYLWCDRHRLYVFVEGVSNGERKSE